MSRTVGAARGPLLGRHAEVGLLVGMLDRIHAAGSTLVLHGEPGIGKSRLLTEAVRLAGERDIAVLQAAGVKTEAHLPFAGVHQLLRPVRARVANLASAHHAALAAAFGVGESESPEPFRIAMAVLDLLSDVAADAPLLVTVDDGHRLDRASADVMAFVARRIESDSIVVLIATREGYPVSFTGAGLPEHRIGALDPTSATELLEASGSHLSAVDAQEASS